MDIQELKNTWQAYDRKLEQSNKLNLRCLEIIQSQKAKSKLTWLFIWRLLEISLHIFVIGFLAKFFYQNFFQLHFLISAAVLLSISIVAFYNCVRQIVLIKQIDYSESITEIQKKLTLLQLHIVNYVRLTFLVLPTFLAYPIIGFKAFVNFDIVKHLSGSWWTGQIIFSILITPLCIWLYRQVSYKNMHKKWVRFIVTNSTGESVPKAMAFINEIDQFKSGIA